jgi:hypothetical protein
MQNLPTAIIRALSFGVPVNKQKVARIIFDSTVDSFHEILGLYATIAKVCPLSSWKCALRHVSLK